MIRNSLATLGLASLVALGLTAGAHAQTATVISGNQFETSGVYSATTYLDIEGQNSGKYFAYSDLNFGTAGYSDVGSVSSLTLSLTSSHAAFSAGPGTLDFFITTDTTSQDYYPGSAYSFNANTGAAAAGQSVGTGIDTTQYKGSVYFLGQGTFTDYGASQYIAENYTFTPNAAVSNYLTDQLNANGNLRFLVALDSAGTNAATTSATFSGPTSSFVSERPTLSLTTVAPIPAPEPSSVFAMLLGVGILGGIVVRHRRVDA